MDCDSDVQSELLAMTGGSMATLGNSRTTNVPSKSEGRNGKVARQVFTIDNTQSAHIAAADKAKQVPIESSDKPTTIPVLSSVVKATKMELETVLRKPANAPEERFLALEARDKLIRLTTTRTTDIKRAVSTRGVCPDMCPEKERMSRISKHRVASFELDDGARPTMDHRLAVKEYSRSSADQEAPLAHELRPEPVLKRTMTYLLQYIMDLCDIEDTSISDWYHFLWDRTRSIRKDITQQELSSPGTVLLVEQCARFHIHCAARLIAEEPQVFDQKINTENLTKCLQSLKYMYHDLGLKMVRCPNEAEFRAYIVLLNLQNTNFLWEVKQLRDDIKQSPEIQFAIKMYLAFESNNYVRFFQLVRSTTYMNACILLRYFTQVRVKALEIMFKAYVPRSRTQMSIEYMTYLLAFEDYEQCAAFLEYYGIQCDRDDDRVIFDRNTFEYPDTPYSLERALNVVEHKRQTTVGEAVHGIPLDTKDVLDGYEPHNSFDDKGILLPSAWSSGDQDYFRPDARIESRAAKQPSVQPKSDESVFKVPALLPRSSPKQRLSPKPASTDAPSDHLFGGSSKFAAPTTALPNNLFAGTPKSNSTPAASDANIFGSFGGFKPQPANPTALKAAKPLFASPAPPAPKRDVTDSLFARPANNTTPASANIFTTTFAPKPDASQTLFSNENLFASSTNESTSMFGGFQSPAAKAKPDSSKSLTFTPSAFSKPAATNLFGGAASNPPAAQSLAATAPKPPNAAKRAEPDDLYDQVEIGELERLRADLIEMERKEREREQQEAKQKAELEDRERQRRLEAERIDRERELKRKQVAEASAALVDGLVGEVLAEDVQRLVREEAERLRKLEEAVQQLYDSIVNDVITRELELLATDLKCTWEKNVLQRFFAGWQMYARKRRQQRAIIANTPQWMPTRPRELMLPELQHPLQARTLSLMKRYRSGQPAKLVVPPQREDTLDIWSIVSPALAKLRAKQQHGASQRPSAVYWKCVISTPDAAEDPSHATIDRWLSNVFTRQASAYPRRPDQPFFAERWSSGDGHCVAVCMRKLCGTQMCTEAGRTAEPTDAHGTNAVLFFVSAKNLRGARDRLQTVLKCVELSDACALVIYGSAANDAVYVKHVLRVDQLLNVDNIDECFFANGMNHRNNATLCQLTKHGLRYAAQHSFYDDRLEMQQTASFLRVTLSDELWHRIHLSISRSPTLRLAAKSFAFLRDYHNESIDRLIGLCTPDCTDSPALFPPELRPFVPAHQFDIPLGLAHFPDDWHLRVGGQQRQLATFFRSLRVHGAIDTGDIGDVAALEQRICQFVHTHIATPADARRTAYKIIENILGHLQPGGRAHGANFAAQLADYNWLDVWPTFAVDLLSSQYQRTCAAGQLAGYVIYDRYEYREYTKSPWWLQVNEPLLKSITEQVERDVDNAIDDYELQSKRQRLEETMAEQENAELQQALARGYAVLSESEKKLSAIKANRTLALDISKDFDMDLYRQERQMRDTKDYLKSLNGN